MYNPLLKHLPKVVVYERNPDCELCSREINPGTENYYRGLKVCPRCHTELEE